MKKNKNSIGDKIKVILLSIPCYPLTILGEWYTNKTCPAKIKFNFIEETKEYWSGIYELLSS